MATCLRLTDKALDFDEQMQQSYVAGRIRCVSCRLNFPRQKLLMAFPTHRPRRLRRDDFTRRLVQENWLRADD